MLVLCLRVICLISKIQIFAMLMVGLSCFGHVFIEYLEILWLKSSTWIYGQSLLQAWSSVLVAQHSVHCLCYTVVTHWPCPRLLLPSACGKGMLDNKLFISCPITAVEVVKYLQIVLGQSGVKFWLYRRFRPCIIQRILTSWQRE